MGCDAATTPPNSNGRIDPVVAKNNCIPRWETVDDFRRNGVDASESSSVFIDPGTRSIFAAGMASDATGAHWLVRTSVDGVTWFTIDDFMYPGAGADAAFVGADANGNLIVGGNAETSTSSRWLVRRSTDGGATWTLVDDYQHPTGSTGLARAMASTGGAIYVAGHSDNLDATVDQYHWIVRKS